MPRELIIPGVSVQVVKEIVPAPLTPSGVVGMLGTSPRGPILEPTPVTSYREFADKFGADPNYTLTRDVKLAFYNGPQPAPRPSPISRSSSRGLRGLGAEMPPWY